MRSGTSTCYREKFMYVENWRKKYMETVDKGNLARVLPFRRSPKWLLCGFSCQEHILKINIRGQPDLFSGYSQKEIAPAL